MSKVCIIETGGTMGPLKHFFDDVSALGVETTLVPLMIRESNVMVPKDWIAMAEAVVENCTKGYDGVVLTHGTDTLAYTSAALSFIIRDLNVPVAVTGSMIEGHIKGTDAVKNLRSSIVFAARSNIAEVCIIFPNSESGSDAAVMRGNRGRKVSSKRLNAFESINAPVLGYVRGDEVQLDERLVLRRRTASQPYLAPRLKTDIVLISYHPALDAKRMARMISGAAGAVIEGYGMGHILTSREMLKTLSGFGGPIVITSQCNDGGVEMKPDHVMTDRELLSLSNVIPVKDMPPETALIKLMWILGNGLPHEQMTKNIAGEIDA